MWLLGKLVTEKKSMKERISGIQRRKHTFSLANSCGYTELSTTSIKSNNKEVDFELKRNKPKANHYKFEITGRN